MSYRLQYSQFLVHLWSLVTSKLTHGAFRIPRAYHKVKVPTYLHDRSGVKRNLRTGTTALIPLLVPRARSTLYRRGKNPCHRGRQNLAMIVSTDQTTDRRNCRTM